MSATSGREVESVEYRSVLRLAQPSARAFLPGLLLGIIATASAVALLGTSAWLITHAAEQPPILYLSFAIVGVRAFALGRAFFRYLERLSTHDAAFRALARLRAGIYRRLIPLSPAGLSGTRRGDLLARLVTDVDRLQDLPLRVVQPLATSIVVCVLAVVAVSIVLPAAGIVLVFSLAIAAVVGTRLDSRLASAAEEALGPLRSELADLVLDHVSRLDVLVAFGQVERSQAVIDDANSRLRDAGLARSTASGAVAATTSLLAGVATLGSLAVGAPAFADGTLTGPLLAVIALVPIAVFEVFAMVPLANGAWRGVRSSAHRVANVAPAVVPVEIPSAPASPVPMPLAPYRLSLDRVSTRWPGSIVDAVRPVSLEALPGDVVLVTGESGSGKSSLANLLVRFLDHSGSYRINGIDVRELEPDAVRTVVGLCEQDPYIFDDSIRQNLLFAREAASDEELRSALGMVGLADWAEDRGGLDARVGERGALVSGGQAQRLALARALLAGFPVLVLDEPTANVDSARADDLLADLLEGAVAAGRIVILISHLPLASPLVTRRLQLS